MEALLEPGKDGAASSIHVGVEKGREGSGLGGSVHVGVEKGREGSGLGGSVHVGVEKKRDGEASGKIERNPCRRAGGEGGGRFCQESRLGKLEQEAGEAAKREALGRESAGTGARTENGWDDCSAVGRESCRRVCGEPLDQAEWKKGETAIGSSSDRTRREKSKQKFSEGARRREPSRSVCVAWDELAEMELEEERLRESRSAAEREESPMSWEEWAEQPLEGYDEDLTPNRDRAFSRQTVYLVHKWLAEGMPLPMVARMLNRSVENVQAAAEVPLLKGEKALMRRYFSPFRMWKETE